MMSKKAVLWIVAGMVAGLAPATANAGIVDNCKAEVRQATTRCTNIVAEDLHRCLPVIRELVAAGDREGAIQAARNCASEIQRVIDACQEHVSQLCRRCVNALLDAGDVGGARRVQQFCVAALDYLDGIEDRALNAIEDTLTGG